MRRRQFLAGVGSSVGALAVTGSASAIENFEFVKSVSNGTAPYRDAPGTVRVDVVGTDVTYDHEVEECVDALDTLLWHPYLSENNGNVEPDVGIEGYAVYGWNSTETFPHSEGCGADGKSAMEISAEKIQGSPLEDVSTVVNWLWDHNASWSAGRGMGEPWGDDPSHQHPTFTDNRNNDSTKKMAFSCAHEVGHALCYTGSGSAWCDPQSYDTQSYEGCSEARRLTAPWFRGHRDHTLGTVLDQNGTLRRTPMGHQGDGWAADPCSYVGDPDYNWTYVPSKCTIEAMGYSWRHLENQGGGHDDEDEDGPAAIDESTISTYDFDPDVYVGWDPVSDEGSAGLAYYGVEVREYSSSDPKGGGIVSEATQTVPAEQDYVVLSGLEDGSKYTVHVTPVDAAGKVPEYDPRARVVIDN